MLNDIEISNENAYNKSIQIVNIYNIAEKDYLYGHDKKFIRLRKEIKKEAHRVISNKALLLCSYSIKFGTAYDINGNLYYFDVFNDGGYRVDEVQKYKDISKEVIYEEYTEKNS